MLIIEGDGVSNVDFHLLRPCVRMWIVFIERLQENADTFCLDKVLVTSFGICGLEF